MGFLTAAFLIWLAKSARKQLAKGNTRLKGTFFTSEEASLEENATQNMGAVKDHPVPKDKFRSDTRWAEGLRGLAAVGVVSSHICLAFFQFLIPPTSGGPEPTGHPILFQRPIFRLVVQGQAFVALFFILMGFVNSLKPLKQAQNHQIEEALLSLARSALNRSARLVLPAATITCLAWLACQFHLNELARKGDAYWLYHTSQAPLPWGVAIRFLRESLMACWLFGDNPYDQPQWALKWLLIGSFWIFCVLLMTITTRPLFRMCVLAAAYVYAWLSADFILGTNIYFGIFLAQLHTVLTSSDRPSPVKPNNIVARFLPYATTILALYLMSYPSDFAQHAGWSNQLANIAAKIAPSFADVGRLWASVGGQILCLSIYFSPPLQNLLSKRIPCYLGSVSFSMYLLHGPLMRSVLAFIVFGPAAIRQEYIKGGDGFLRYPIPPRWTLLLSLPLFGMILMSVVHAWAVRVEPIFARATKALEDFATGKHSKGGPASPLQPPANGRKNHSDVS